MSALHPINPTADLAAASPQPAARPLISATTLIAACLAILASLALGFTAYAAREFLIPIAIALLLAIILSPIARALEQRGAAPIAASGAITLLLLAALVVLGLLMAPELANLSEQLPEGARRLEEAVIGLRESLSGLERASVQIQEATQQAGVAPTSEPVVVQQSTPLSIALSSLAQFAAQSAAAILLMFFLLAQRRRMKAIIIAMTRTNTTRKRLITMFNDIKTRIAHCLLAITTTSVGVGAAVALALYSIDFPNPLLWGAALALFNFVPYAGPLAVQVAALIVGALTYATIWEAVTPALIIWGLSTIEGQVITPLFVARRVVLNPLSVVLAVIFGGWIWGIIGAVVAVPGLIVAASVIQHWWAPCSTVGAPSRPWRSAWAFQGRLAIAPKRTGLGIHAADIDRDAHL